MIIKNNTTRIITIASAVLACSLLISSICVTAAHAGAHYDRGEKVKGFTYNHKKVSESKAKQACDGDKKDECVECIEHRANLQGLKGYEVVKCFKEPTKYNY